MFCSVQNFGFSGLQRSVRKRQEPLILTTLWRKFRQSSPLTRHEHLRFAWWGLGSELRWGLCSVSWPAGGSNLVALNPPCPRLLQNMTRRAVVSRVIRVQREGNVQLGPMLPVVLVHFRRIFWDAQAWVQDLYIFFRHRMSLQDSVGQNITSGGQLWAENGPAKDFWVMTYFLRFHEHSCNKYALTHPQPKTRFG